MHAKIAAALDALGKTAEVIFVDDGSTDGTSSRGPSGGQMREGRRRKGLFPLQDAPTKQMAPDRANPEGKGQMGRMASLRPTAVPRCSHMPS